MKIGIVTYHRAENFGAMLQAAALRSALEQLGHDAYFIDYWPTSHNEVYKSWRAKEFKRRSIFRKCKYIAGFLMFWLPRHKRHTHFQHFLNNYIKPYCLPENAEVDVALYGSDQIWGRFPFANAKFDAVYFGENGIQAKRHSSYAASMGSSLINDSEAEFLKTHLCKFDKLSVREQDVKALLDKLGLKNVTVNCDPTLLLSADNWKSMMSAKRLVNEPYALYYNLIPDSFDETSMRKIIKAHGLRLITITGGVGLSCFNRNELPGVGPEDFMRLIHDAEFVFTSSYHGLVFSIIFQKNFYASYRSKNSRAQTLLSTLGLTGRLLGPGVNLSDIRMSSIDYTIPSRLLKDYIKQSKDYLATL